MLPHDSREQQDGRGRRQYPEGDAGDPLTTPTTARQHGPGRQVLRPHPRHPGVHGSYQPDDRGAPLVNRIVEASAWPKARRSFYQGVQNVVIEASEHREVFSIAALAANRVEVGSRVTIEQDYAFHGKVLSRRAACERNRTVAVYVAK